MKRSISLVLCLAMLISVFSCLGVTASAAGNAEDLFTVKSSGFKNDKITYTVYLNSGVNMSGAVIYAQFDPDVLAIDKANTGACMVDDGDGGERESINGIYEQDFMAGVDNKYSVAHTYGQDVDYKPGSSNKPYIKFTFKAIDGERPETAVRLYCYEFYSASNKDNNIPNGSSVQFYKFEGTTLSETTITDVVSEKDGVRISWKATAGADKYRIYKKNAEGSYVTLDYTENGDVTTYLDTEVENNTVYTYTVRAMNEAGLNSFYDKEGVSTRYTIAPKTLEVSNDDGEVLVKWSKVAGATSYRVYRRSVDADGDVTAWTYLSGKITDLEFVDMTAKSGAKYEYAIRVYSNGGNSDLYSEKEIVHLDTPVISVSATVKGVKVAWEQVEGAVSYRVYRKVSGGSWTRIKSTTSTSYTDSEASSGKKIYYMVKAVNGAHTSDYKAKSLTYIATPTVSVKNISTGINVSWNKVSGATSYQVYRKTGSATSWTKIATTKNASYTDKSAKSGKLYKYCVRAVGSVNSAFGGSSYETIRFLSTPVLKKITSTQNGVTVSWGEVTGASKYFVYRKTGSGEYELVKTLSGTKYTDKDTEKGKTYTYKVYAGYSSYISSYKSTLSIKDKY